MAQAEREFLPFQMAVRAAPGGSSPHSCFGSAAKAVQTRASAAAIGAPSAVIKKSLSISI